MEWWTCYLLQVKYVVIKRCCVCVWWPLICKLKLSANYMLCNVIYYVNKY